jgi:uncharacterized protein
MRISKKSGKGVTSDVAAALALFERDMRSAYGARIVEMLLFGSRARGDARADSDIDVAIILRGPIESLVAERIAIAGIAYDAIARTGIHVQGHR